MRLVIQRVNSASVRVKGMVVGSIGKGLFILLGVGEGDTEANVQDLVEKVLKMRIMADDKAKMNLSILDTTKQILVVSQFTLYADTSKGNRPSFVQAAEPKEAGKLYEHFVVLLREKGIDVQTGSFGEYMDIATQLDGPVTILEER